MDPAAAAAGGLVGGGEQQQPAAKRRKGAGGGAAGAGGPAGPPRPRGRPKRAAGDAAAAGAGGADGGGAGGGGGGARKRKGGGKAAAAKEGDALDELVARDEGRPGAGAGEDDADENLGKVHTGVFAKELPSLMYGFGDTDNPLKETVDLVEDIALQFITDTVHAAMRAAAVRNAGTASGAAAKKDELKLEDVLYAVRRDPRKVARIQELIQKQKEIAAARRPDNALKEEGIDIAGIE